MEKISYKFCLKVKEIIISIARVGQKTRGERHFPRVCKKPLQTMRFKKLACIQPL